MKRLTIQLEKLRGKSLKELRERAGQELNKLGERMTGLSTEEMSDARFYRQISPAERNGSAKGTAQAIARRIEGGVTGGITAGVRSGGNKFFPSFDGRDEIRSIMECRFPDQSRAIIERAERAIRGRFDLLGLSDLSFGQPVDWHLEPVSGKRAPRAHWSRIKYLDPTVAGDKKITWELNRHQHFVTFGQAHRLTGDERFAEAFVAQASSWMDANPPGVGINWASSLEVAFRAVAWIWALHLLAGSRHLSGEFVLRALKHLSAHGRHIEKYLSHYFSPNTHLSGEALGLFYLGVALPEFRRAGKWQRLGLGILVEQLSRQVREDGVYFEQATYYHRYTADFYTHLLVLARAANIVLPFAVEEKLAALLDHLMWITRPDGTSPLVGDDDGGRLIKLGERRLDDFRDTLAAGAALFGRGDWKYVAGGPAVETLWLLGPEGLARYDEIRGVKPEAKSRAFAASGYYVMRDEWEKDSSFVLMDCGPHGAMNCGHAHADALSLEFASEGKPWLIDPGTFTYTADSRLRDEFRATHAHNTATVDGESQSVPAGAFSWHHIALAKDTDFIGEESFDYLEGAHDGYERLSDPVTHRRAVLFTKTAKDCKGAARLNSRLNSYLVVRDRFTATDRHHYAMRYHLAPGCSAVAIGNHVKITRPRGERLDLIAFGRVMPRAQILSGWASSSYGARTPSLIVAFEAEGIQAQEFVTFALPLTREGAIHIEQTDHSARGFLITTGNVMDAVLIGNGSDRFECGPLSATGQIAWGRFVNDRLAKACLIHGRSLETSDGLSLDHRKPVRYLTVSESGNGFEVRVDGTGKFFTANNRTQDARGLRQHSHQPELMSKAAE